MSIQTNKDMKPKLQPRNNGKHMSELEMCFITRQLFLV